MQVDDTTSAFPHLTPVASPKPTNKRKYSSVDPEESGKQFSQETPLRRLTHNIKPPTHVDIATGLLAMQSKSRSSKSSKTRLPERYFFIGSKYMHFSFIDLTQIDVCNFIFS